MISNEKKELFACTQCGECCKGYGGTFVTQADIEKIANYIGVPANFVYKDYCVLSGELPVLAQRPDGYCIFWEGNCTIHPVKPRMCRDWPFIGTLLVDMGNWAVMADCCPGINRAASAQDVLEAVLAQQMISVRRRA